MTDFRKPVITVRDGRVIESSIIHALPCRGCEPQRNAHRLAVIAGTARNRHFTCPNRGSGTDHCHSHCFQYPRLVRERDDNWHFHQGIDVHGEEGVSQILSVTAGTVHFARNERTSDAYGGYGKVVVVHTAPYWYLYAHCHEVLVQTGDTVDEAQPIATVGRTQYLSDGRVSSDTMRPHLHFEVSRERYPIRDGRNRETALDNDNSTMPRIDPGAHLRDLGPWGPKRFFFPLVSGATDEDDYEVTAERTVAMYEATERDNPGGTFPLGANNVWHGGVHLHGSPGSLVRAPFDGRVVAARLDADPRRARGYFGSMNFVLLHHELPANIVEQLRSEGGSASREPWRGAVGEFRGTGRRRREVPNTSSDVVEVKRLLHGAGHYDPEDSTLLTNGTAEPGFIEAILAFQRTFVRRPDGVIDIPGSSYRRLQQAEQARQREQQAAAARERGEPEPRPSLVYSLFMHLHPETLDDALAERIPWLARVQLEPSEEERQQEERDRREREQRVNSEITEDGADRDYAMQDDVGPPRRRRGPANTEDDVRWVQRRLTRHGHYSGPADGQWSDAVDQGVRAFQSEHVAYYRNRTPDAGISAGRATDAALRQTPAELEAAAEDPQARDGGIDRRLVSRAAERSDEAGPTAVVTDLDARISAGEPLWTAGVGRAFNDTSVRAPAPAAPAPAATGVSARAADASAPQPIIHWSIFSEEPLIGAWDEIEDTDNADLTVDVASLINRAQQRAQQQDADDEDGPQGSEGEDTADSGEGEDAPGGSEGEAAPDGSEDRAPSDQAAAGSDGSGSGGPAGALREDEILSVEEIHRFYASEDSHFLRRVQCRFNSEWGLDLDQTVDALRGMGWNTRLLSHQMAPYMWWEEAGDAVPGSAVVWHYNPVAFLELYWQQYPRGEAPAEATAGAAASPTADPAATPSPGETTANPMCGGPEPVVPECS